MGQVGEGHVAACRSERESMSVSDHEGDAMGQIEDTVKTILELREQIQRFGVALKGSESDTKLVLVNPLLASLGWTVGQLDEVRTEYSTPNGVADYALLDRETMRPEYIIEAKSLGLELSQAVAQSMRYSYGLGVRLAVMTNGDEWAMFDFPVDGEGEMRLVTSFSITKSDAVMVALASHAIRNPASSEIVGEELGRIYEVATNLQNPESQSLAYSQPRTDKGEWYALDALQNVEKEGPPSHIKFYDGFVMPIGRWKDLVKWVGLWLAFIREELTEDDCGDDEFRTRTRYIAHNSPRKLNDPIPVGDGVYVEGNVNRAAAIRNSCELLRHCNVDLSLVQVSYD